MDDATTSLIVLKELAGHAPTTLDPLQQFIHAHYGAFQLFWIVLWYVTAAVLLITLWYEYKRQKKSK